MTPTIGRIVHYFPSESEKNALTTLGNNRQDVMAAVVVAVWSDSCLNLKVLVDGGHADLWKTSTMKFVPAEGRVANGSGTWDWPVKV